MHSANIGGINTKIRGFKTARKRMVLTNESTVKFYSFPTDEAICIRNLWRYLNRRLITNRL